MQESEARLPHTIMDNLFSEHGKRARPQSEFAVERAIDDKLLLRLAVPRDAKHLVEIALVVSIHAETQTHRTTGSAQPELSEHRLQLVDQPV